jgi:hypothetical protein
MNSNKKYLAHIDLEKCLAPLPESVGLVNQMTISGVMGSNECDLSRLRVEPIHQRFANWRSGPDDIVEFTRRYGLLDWGGELVGQKKVPGLRFGFLVDHWRQRQNEIRELWETAPGGPDGVAWFTLPSAGDFPIATESDRWSRRFAYGDTADDGELIWQTPETLWERIREGPIARIRAWTTWQYVCLLLTFEKMESLRKCENPECAAPYFIARRKDQMFCGEDCAHRIAANRWWSRHGNQWRRTKATRKRRRKS